EGAAEEKRGGGHRRHRASNQEPQLHGFCCPFVFSNPLNGSALYGNLVMYGTSFASTPSPSGRLCPMRTPPTARSAMSITSSSRRRPFGQPARSPPSTPRRLPPPTAAVGAIARFRRISSACVS